MQREELLRNTEKNITEINEKIQQLKQMLPVDAGNDLRQKTDSAIRQLEDIRDRVQERYEELRKSDERKDLDFSEMEKNIYNGVEAFDEAFTRAGGLFRKNK